MYTLLTQIIQYNYRDNYKSTISGWGSSTILQSTDLTIIPQSICNTRYSLSDKHDLYNEVKKELPNLFQDDLLCAAHDVSIVIIG